MTPTVMAAGSSGDPQDSSSSIPTALAGDFSLATLSLGPVQHIAYFSDNGGAFTYDLSNLRSYKDPIIPRNMNEGKRACVAANRTNKRIGHPKPIDELLLACQAHGTLAVVRNAHVVTARGEITKLMIGESLDLYLSFIDGILYVVEADPDPNAIHVGQIESSYQGLSFEALCTQTKPGEPIKVNMGGWKCVVTRTLGDLNLVYGAEVDCVRGQYIGDSSNLMELKTLREGATNWRRRKWYFQSRLVDISEIVVGFWTPGPTLTRVQSFSTEACAPDAKGLLQARNNAYIPLQTLRHSCASYPFRPEQDPDDAIWIATIRDGKVKQCRLLNGGEVAKARIGVSGKRLGLLPEAMVAELRKQ